MSLGAPAFRSISMRGRVAYALMCLEEAIAQTASEPGQWMGVLTRLWNYTSAEWLDDWQDEAAEITPRVVVGCEGYAEGDFEHLTEGEFSTLRTLYETNEPFLGELVNLVFDIGSVEMFGGIEDGAPRSLRTLGNVLLIMNAHGIEAPFADLVADQSFAVCRGWGSRFHPGDLSRFIKSPGGS